MLTFEENLRNFQTIKILSQINFLPFQVNVERGEIRQLSKSDGNRWRLTLWKILYFSQLLYTGYLIFRWIELLQDGALQLKGKSRTEFQFQLKRLIVNFAWVAYFCVTSVWQALHFLSNFCEVNIVFNHLYKGRDRVEKVNDKVVVDTVENDCDENEEENLPTIQPTFPKKRNITNLTKLTVHELLTLGLLWMLIATPSFAMVILAMDPHRPQMLYAALPSTLQNRATYVFLLGVEGGYLAMITGCYYFSLVLQSLFLQKCEAQFSRLFSELRSGTVEIRQVIHDTKELFLFIELFNRAFPTIIFSYKVFCLILAICSSTFAIRFFSDAPFLGIFACSLAFNCMDIFCITYQQGFSVHSNFVKIERLVEVYISRSKSTNLTNSSSNNNSNNVNPGPSSSTPSTQRHLTQTEINMIRREIRGIRKVGINVGSFHIMERTSTLIFVHFIVTNVTSLLITFPA